MQEYQIPVTSPGKTHFTQIITLLFPYFSPPFDHIILMHAPSLQPPPFPSTHRASSPPLSPHSPMINPPPRPHLPLFDCPLHRHPAIPGRRDPPAHHAVDERLDRVHVLGHGLAERAVLVEPGVALDLAGRDDKAARRDLLVGIDGAAQERRRGVGVGEAGGDVVLVGG